MCQKGEANDKIVIQFSIKTSVELRKKLNKNNNLSVNIHGVARCLLSDTFQEQRRPADIGFGIIRFF